jgi:Flp pilus assembly pilin Flp
MCDWAVKVLKLVKGFVLDESGLETVEWAIVGGLIVAVTAAFFALIAGDTMRGITSLRNAIPK